MAFRDLRVYLGALEERGWLKHVAKEVDKGWEISSIARCMFQGVEEDQRYGLYFDRVMGFDVPVVTGVLGASRQIYAFALGTTPDNIYEKWADSLAHPIPPVVVETGPVKEVIKRGDEVDLFQLPAPIWTPGRDDFT